MAAGDQCLRHALCARSTLLRLGRPLVHSIYLVARQKSSATFSRVGGICSHERVACVYPLFRRFGDYCSNPLASASAPSCSSLESNRPKPVLVCCLRYPRALVYLPPWPRSAEVDCAAECASSLGVPCSHGWQWRKNLARARCC